MCGRLCLCSKLKELAPGGCKLDAWATGRHPAGCAGGVHGKLCTGWPPPLTGVCSDVAAAHVAHGGCHLNHVVQMLIVVQRAEVPVTGREGRIPQPTKHIAAHSWSRPPHKATRDERHGDAAVHGISGRAAGEQAHLPPCWLSTKDGGCWVASLGQMLGAEKPPAALGLSAAGGGRDYGPGSGA